MMPDLDQRGDKDGMKQDDDKNGWNVRPTPRAVAGGSILESNGYAGDGERNGGGWDDRVIRRLFNISICYAKHARSPLPPCRRNRSITRILMLLNRIFTMGPDGWRPEEDRSASPPARFPRQGTSAGG